MTDSSGSDRASARDAQPSRSWPRRGTGFGADRQGGLPRPRAHGGVRRFVPSRRRRPRRRGANADSGTVVCPAGWCGCRQARDRTLPRLPCRIHPTPGWVIPRSRWLAIDWAEWVSSEPSRWAWTSYANGRTLSGWQRLVRHDMRLWAALLPAAIAFVAGPVSAQVLPWEVTVAEIEAGRLRNLAQRLTKQNLLYQLHLGNVRKEQLVETVSQIDGTIRSLEKGNPSQTIPAPWTPEIRDQVRKVDAAWGPVRRIAVATPYDQLRVSREFLPAQDRPRGPAADPLLRRPGRRVHEAEQRAHGALQRRVREDGHGDLRDRQHVGPGGDARRAGDEGGGLRGRGDRGRAEQGPPRPDHQGVPRGARRERREPLLRRGPEPGAPARPPRRRESSSSACATTGTPSRPR